MRNSRVAKAALPFLAGAALIGTAAPAASAAVPHKCGASSTFQSEMANFIKSYDKGDKTLSGPTGSTPASLAAYLGKATAFFKREAAQWAKASKDAPSELKSNFNTSVTYLNKTVADFAHATSAIKAGKVSAMTADVKRAQADANKFEGALQPLTKKCG